MDETEKGVQRVVRKGSSRKRNDPSGSKKSECGDKNKDDKNKAITNVSSSLGSDEKQGPKKRGRKKKIEVKVLDNEKNIQNIIPALKESELEKEDSTVKSTKIDPLGMSLRRSRKTRQSGSSMSDREMDTIIKIPDDHLMQGEEGRNSEKEEQVSKISITTSKEEPEMKNSKSIQVSNEDNQINSNENIVEKRTAEETQNASENSRRRGKNTAIKESGLKNKEAGERPTTRHATRSSSRTLSKGYDSISSESERDCTTQEIPVMGTESKQTRQRSKAISQKLKENVDQIESLSSELDIDIELQKNIVIKKSEKMVTSIKGLQESNPKSPTTVRKRGRRKLNVQSSSSYKKTEVKSSVDTESVSAGDEVLNNKKNESKLNLPEVSKQTEGSLSEGTEIPIPDMSINAEMEKEHEKEGASSDFLSKDNLDRVTEEERKIMSIDTNNDKIYKSSVFMKDDNSSFSQEKGCNDKEAVVTVKRGRRGRKKMHQARGRKFNYKTKSSPVLSASDSKNDGIASNDKDTLQVPNQDDVVSVIETRMSRKRKSTDTEESEKEKFKNFPSEESINKVQRLDSLSCPLPKKQNLPLEFNEISRDSNTELYSNTHSTVHPRKNKKKNLEKYESVLDHDSSYVDIRVKGKVSRGRKRRGGMQRRVEGNRITRKLRLSSVDLSKRNAKLVNQESYLEDFKGNFLINDLSVVVEKLDLNDPEIIKLMSHTEKAPSIGEKSKEIDPSITVNIDISDSDTIVASTLISEPTEESLEKEVSAQIGTESTDEITSLNAEDISELSENQVQNSEILIQTENTLMHCDDQESENIQITGSKNLITSTDKVKQILMHSESPVAINVSICKSNEISDLDQDIPEDTLESKSLCEREIKEKPIIYESISSNLESDTTSTCDKNKLSTAISTNTFEKTTENQDDLEKPIIGNEDETISTLLEHTCDSSGTSIEKTINSPEIICNVPIESPVAINVSICKNNEISDLDQDIPEDTLESKSPCEKEIKEKPIVFESISNNLESDTTSTCDKNKLSTAISTNTFEKTTENQGDPEKPIIGNEDETNSTILEHTCDSSGTSIEKTEEKTINSPEIICNVPIESPVAINVSICKSNEISDMDQDIPEDTLESKSPCEREIKEKQVLESISNNLESDTTCDKNKLSTEISTNTFEKNRENQDDLEEPIIGNEDETISTLSEHTCDSSGPTIEKTEEKTTNSPEIICNDPITESESNKIIETEDISFVLSSSECSEDNMYSETVLFSVRQGKMKECYVDMSKAIDISQFYSKKKADSFSKRPDTERQIPLNSSVSPSQNNSIDIIDTEYTTATFETVNVGEEETGKELVVNAGLELRDVPDSGPEDEIVVALEDNRDANGELEKVREVNIAPIKDTKEITGSVLDVVSHLTDADKEVTEVDFQDKNNILEDQKNAFLKETLVQNNVTLKDEITINVLKSKEGVIHDANENALKEVSEKSLGEIVKSNTTFGQAESDAALETVDGVEKNKNDTALEQVGVKEQEKSGTVLQLSKDKCELTLVEDDKNICNNTNIEDLKEDASNVNAEREKEIECVTTEEEDETALGDKTNELLKAQIKPKITGALKPQLINSNSETNEDTHTKEQTVESQNEVSPVLEHKSKGGIPKKISFFAGDTEVRPNFIESDLYKILQKYFDMGSLPINFSSAPINSKPGSSKTEATPAQKRKFDEVEPKKYYWPSFLKQQTWQYLQPFIPVLRQALLSIMDNKPKDQLEYFSQWLIDHKAEAYFTMASIPMDPTFNSKKRKNK